MMFIKTRIFCKSPSTILYGTYIWLLTRMYTYMILIVCCTSKGFTTFRLRAFIRTFASMCSYMHLNYMTFIRYIFKETPSLLYIVYTSLPF